MTGIQIINRISEMCDESLDPDTHNKWIAVRTELLLNRKSLKTDNYTTTSEKEALQKENGDILGDLHAAEERCLKLLENASIANGAVEQLQAENTRLRDALEKIADTECAETQDSGVFWWAVCIAKKAITKTK